LQDITKNLISGVVLLFEKPIQTGDFVELGDLCGTVQGIRLRSTVIRTIDHIAIIVPNSEFLDRQVVNWSHHDSVSRLRLSVGVAYGSDTQRVRRSLLEAARQCAQVLSVPAPEVQFTGFGDSSLDFLLLVWIRDPGDQFTVTSDLNFAIDARFRLAGIQIPFPQRDVHLRGETVRVSLDAESLRGLRELGGEPGEGAPGGGAPVP
jgi:small-conductance mechanosensitive channel